MALSSEYDSLTVCTDSYDDCYVTFIPFHFFSRETAVCLLPVSYFEESDLKKSEQYFDGMKSKSLNP